MLATIVLKKMFPIHMIIAALRELLNLILNQNFSFIVHYVILYKWGLHSQKWKWKAKLQKQIKFKIETVAPPTSVSKR